jgi:hypothetical protein
MRLVEVAIKNAISCMSMPSRSAEPKICGDLTQLLPSACSRRKQSRVRALESAYRCSRRAPAFSQASRAQPTRFTVGPSSLTVIFTLAATSG